MTGAAELSVVLVNHNGADCLPAALAALRANTAEPELEVVVVDSGSGDGSWRGLEDDWDRVRVLRFEENLGFCAGCNRGAEAAAGRLVAFVNFDGEVEPGWDRPLAAQLADPGVSAATGLVLRPDGGELESAGLAIAPTLAAYALMEGRPRADAPAAPMTVPAASGGLMMVRREDFLALAGFYEPIWMYGEETDYALRVPGRIVLDPASALRHETGHAAGPMRSALRLYWHSRNRLANAARHLPPLALARTLAASAAFDLVTLAQVRTAEGARATVRGWRDGLRLMRAQRRTRSAAERRVAASRVGSLRQAVAQQRALGRLG